MVKIESPRDWAFTQSVFWRHGPDAEVEKENPRDWVFTRNAKNPIFPRKMSENRKPEKIYYCGGIKEC